MTGKDKQLLAEFDYGSVSSNTFQKNFSIDIRRDAGFVRRELKAAMDRNDAEAIQMTIALVWLSGTPLQFVGELNELLINPITEAISKLHKHYRTLPVQQRFRL